jgi:hypothetical protein
MMVTTRGMTTSPIPEEAGTVLVSNLGFVQEEELI